MTNQELSAAIRDLDEQLEEFVQKNIDDLLCESCEGALRITEVPERFHRTSESSASTADDLDAADKSVEYFGHQPTKWIGWLLVTFAAYCLGVLVWAVVRAK